jgi:flagellar basal body-associated protein FliL
MAKLKIIIPILLVAAVGYKFVLAKPAAAEPKPHVNGTVYILGKEFLLNLADGRFAKLTAAVVLGHDDTSTEASGEGSSPPEGFGNMSQEAIVRSIVTDQLTGAKDDDLITEQGREETEKTILKRIKKETDVKAEEVVFTDITVQ